MLMCVYKRVSAGCRGSGSGLGNNIILNSEKLVQYQLPVSHCDQVVVQKSGGHDKCRTSELYQQLDPIANAVFFMEISCVNVHVLFLFICTYYNICTLTNR